MDDFVRLSFKEKIPYFEKAAAEKKFNNTLIIEKDFWVCWTLKYLFSVPKLSSHMTFKGGTSLSKAFGLIRRFSEDIDITIHRSFFGFFGEKEPENKSREKREKLLDELQSKIQEYVATNLLNKMEADFKNLFGPTGWKLYLDHEDADRQTLSFEYPTEANQSGYLKPLIKIEFGARGEDWPTELRSFMPMLSEAIPDALKSSEVKVQTLSPQRTFWEKATILHSYFYWPDSKEVPIRQSRHYYDIFCLLKSPLRSDLLNDSELLEKVADHKKKFFRSGPAKYDLAKRGSLKLLGNERVEKIMEKDYKAMKEMLFGEVFTWEQITDELRNFEKAFNEGSR